MLPANDLAESFLEVGIRQKKATILREDKQREPTCELLAWAHTLT